MHHFHMKTKVVFGKDSLEKLAELKSRKICVVCDPFIAESDLLKKLLSSIGLTNEIHIFSDIVPDPPIASIAKGIAKVDEIQPEVMIAVGGGSAIDTAKGIRFFAEKLTKTALEQFIAIPTTSGTGSEVTSAAVITDPVNKVKYPLFQEELVPDIAILDARLVESVPGNVTANTGMDVLTHALEAYVSTDATVFTDALAEKAVKLTLHSLEQCYENGNDLVSREEMHNASTLAGMAFNLSNLGVCHSIAHQLGAQFHIAHGLANALLLGDVIAFNASHSKRACQKYAQLARTAGIVSFDTEDVEAVASLIVTISKMMNNMNMPQSLSELGISEEQIHDNCHRIAENAMLDACFATNPVPLSHEEIVELVHRIM